MISAFISYAHADERLKNRLMAHLRALDREGLVRAWHDRKLLPGSHLDQGIEQELSASTLVLLLISPDFINSDYCSEREMQRAFARAKTGECQVIAIIGEPCQWRKIPIESGGRLGDFLALPRDGKAITEWPNENSVLNDIVEEVRRVLPDAPDACREPKLAGQEHAGSRAPKTAGAAVGRQRSTDLGLSRRASDLDRSEFLERSFEHMATSFARDLDELQSANKGLVCRFLRRDSRSFVASVFVDGMSIGGVRIFRKSLLSRHESICLSYDLDSNENSWNEAISIDEVGGKIVLAAMGMPHFSRHDIDLARLDADGAATYFWDLLINHVKAHQRSLR